jgi:hypothetical protein
MAELRDQFRVYFFSQLVHFKFLIRADSRSLAVTSLFPVAIACAAICISRLPTSAPALSKLFLNLA